MKKEQWLSMEKESTFQKAARGECICPMHDTWETIDLENKIASGRTFCSYLNGYEGGIYDWFFTIDLNWTEEEYQLHKKEEMYSVVEESLLLQMFA